MGVCEVTRTLAEGNRSRKVLCLSDDEVRKASSTGDQLAASSNFHIMHYVRIITSNETFERATSKQSLQDSMLHAISHLPVSTSVNRPMKSVRRL